MSDIIISARDLNLYYGDNHALKNVNIDIEKNKITALIGPSGCGKSTFLKTLNRMNDLIENVKITGEVLFDDENIYKRCLKLRDHGRAVSNKMFWNDEVGYKYNMSSLQAALGIAQLERIEELVQKKRNIFNWYKNELGDIEGIFLNEELEATRNNYWMVTVAWDNKMYDISKEQFINELKQYNIDSRPFFYPLSMEPAYEEITKDIEYSKLNTVAYKLSPYAVNLPCGMMMTEEVVKRVCDKVKEILKLEQLDYSRC